MDDKLSMLQKNKPLKIENQRKKFFRSVSNYFEEFSKNTSIHGFKYLVNTSGCTLEKVWWLVVLFLCIYVCAGFILMTLKKKDNPVFVSFHQSPMHMWDIPFPAVTICPASRFKATKYNFTDSLQKYERNELDKEGLQRFLDMNIFCKNPHYDHHLVHVAQHKFDTESLNFFLNHSFSLEDILSICMTNKKHMDCVKYFSPMLTGLGLCFSINMLDKSDLLTDTSYVPKGHINHRKTLHWSFDDNYIKTLNDTFPLRITRITDGLFLSLRHSEPDIDKTCEKFKGFNIFLHHPGEMPIFLNKYALLAPNEHYIIWLKPDVMTTSSNLDRYAPHERGCFFSNERRLKFFKIYTAHNCKLECSVNHTLERCGCVPYYMPRDPSTAICGLTNMSCVHDAKETFLDLDMELDICKESGISRKPPSSEICDCLPACTSIAYNTEVSPERLDPIQDGNSSYTMVHIHFKDTSFVTMERNELFSKADFWASCGGLLGLFTGFSVVSLAEIVYFLTMKWICNLWNATRRVR